MSEQSTGYFSQMGRFANRMRPLALLILLALWPAGSVVLGADPQPYSVTLKPTGNSALDRALRDAATLISLQDKPPVGGFALVQRARQDEERFRSVLQSYGYYAANIDIAVAGHPITDPALPD